jgi:(p)ppGpp synthase/HD superfamily hydrolase
MGGMATLERAIAIAVQAHQGVKDRAGRAYILHPIGVMARVKSEKEKIVAILHDVVEDSVPPNRWDFADLRAEGFGEDILAALDGVTKRPGEAYEAFILRALPNPLARTVKIADLEDNMDLRRLDIVTEKDQERFNKYLRAWTLLTAENDRVPQVMKT